MKICVAQINTTVGCISSNLKHIENVIAFATKEKAEILVFPECALSGFPIADLVHHEGFLDECHKALREVASMAQNCSVIIGCPTRVGRGVYSTAILFSKGKEIGRQYGRTLIGAQAPETIDLWTLGPYKLQICIGEIPPILDEEATIVVHMSSDPWSAGSREEKISRLCRRAKTAKTNLLHVNQVGGNDGLIYDGGSFFCDSFGKIVWQAARFTEAVASTNSPSLYKAIAPMEEVRQALLLGIFDYVRKQGYTDLIVGTSGGIDSSVVATLATQAIGKEHVKALFLPYTFTSQESVVSATQLAKNLGIQMTSIPIEQTVDAMCRVLTDAGMPPKGIPLENIQSRLRAVILMAFANTERRLLLTTGNKSEAALGYATLYGDMCGALAPIGDLLKTEVYHLAEFINSQTAVIPEIALRRPPTAELAPNQKDSDDLPEYAILDPVISAFVNQGIPPSQSSSPKLADASIQDIYRRMWRAEYKRRQAACVLKVSPTCFGVDRRYPIVNGYGN